MRMFMMDRADNSGLAVLGLNGIDAGEGADMRKLAVASYKQAATECAAGQMNGAIIAIYMKAGHLGVFIKGDIIQRPGGGVKRIADIPVLDDITERLRAYFFMGVMKKERRVAVGYPYIGNRLRFFFHRIPYAYMRKQ